jgi:hypothetical protein
MAQPLLSTDFASWRRKESQGRFEEDGEMFKLQDQISESALCVGIVAALIWGMGLSVYGFNQPQEQLSWLAWGAQLVVGVVACLIVPLAFVRGGQWVAARIQPGEPLQRR